MNKTTSIDLERRLKIDHQEWTEYRKQYIKDYIRSGNLDGTTDRESLNDITKIHIRYLETGDARKFIRHCELHEASREKYDFGYQTTLARYSAVASVNPSRNYETYISNILYYWNWVFESPEERLYTEIRLRGLSYDEAFWKATGLCFGFGLGDIEIEARYFKDVYGDTFSEIVEFPYSIGKDGWKPKKELDFDGHFFDLSNCIGSYLSYQKDHISHASPVRFVEYWLSMFDYLKGDALIPYCVCSLVNYGPYLEGELSEEEDVLVQRQEAFIRFFGNLYGHDVDPEYSNSSYFYNDPELCEYLYLEIESKDLPQVFFNFLDFIKKHKDDALRVAIEAGSSEPMIDSIVEGDKPSLIVPEAINLDQEVHEETELTLDLVDFCKKHNFRISREKLLSVKIGLAYEIEEDLSIAFEEYGSVAFAESGTTPSEHLPLYTQQVLRTLEAKGWHIEACTSENNWKSAKILLTNDDSGDQTELDVKRVNDSDYLPETFEDIMRKFAEQHCEKTIRFLYRDDPFLMLPLTKEQDAELREIVAKHEE